jgi:exosortase E/protease (VPEID-CTERM system)
MAVFGLIWLVLFRKQVRLARAMALIPVGIVVLFLLNSARIAGLVLVGDRGAPDIAMEGFHSQVGWIAFNAVAFGFVAIAGRLPWISVRDSGAAAEKEPAYYAAAPWLVPFLAILAAGMLARAATAAFEWLYPLRFGACVAALWIFRKKYRELDWRCGWIGPALGAVVFVLWTGKHALDHSPMPAPLAAAGAATRIAWIAIRVVSAAITVPIAEELAFRGFLLRRLVAADFEPVAFQPVRWLPILISSAIFGVLHGDHQAAGIAAGVLYALAASWRGRLSDAIAAHATTNALLAVAVLVFHNWALW